MLSRMISDVRGNKPPPPTAPAHPTAEPDVKEGLLSRMLSDVLGQNKAPPQDQRDPLQRTSTAAHPPRNTHQEHPSLRRAHTEALHNPAAPDISYAEFLAWEQTAADVRLQATQPSLPRVLTPVESQHGTEDGSDVGSYDDPMNMMAAITRSGQALNLPPPPVSVTVQHTRATRSTSSPNAAARQHPQPQLAPAQQARRLASSPAPIQAQAGEGVYGDIGSLQAVCAVVLVCRCKWGTRRGIGKGGDAACAGDLHFTWAVRP